MNGSKGSSAQGEAKPGLRGYVQAHRYGLALMLGFVVACGVTGPLLFPDVHVARSVVGGCLLGIICTFCVALNRFLR